MDSFLYYVFYATPELLQKNEGLIDIRKDLSHCRTTGVLNGRLARLLTLITPLCSF